MGTIQTLEADAAPTITLPKMQLFADTYLSGKSATQAAIDAGYAEKSAGVTAYKLLRRPDIAEYVRYHKAKATEQSGDLQTQLIAELSALAFSNIDDYTTLDADGQRQIDFSNTTREQLRAISSVQNKRRKIYSAKGDHIATEEQSKFTLWSKDAAIGMLGKHLGMFKEPEQRIVVDVADRLLGARARMLEARRSADGDDDGAT